MCSIANLKKKIQNFSTSDEPQCVRDVTQKIT